MDWMKRLNQSIDYIEQHLAEELDYEKIAEIADCPSYYFQQMFLYMSGITLREYIRRRRLSLAAVELQKDNEKVIDIALKYGYESSTAFTRAFKNFHGVAPSAIKEEGASLQAYPPIRFTISVNGEQPLKFRVEEKEAFRIIGVTCPLERELTKNFEVIPSVWDAALADGTLARMGALIEGEPQGLLGISVHHTEDWKYFLAVRSDKTDEHFDEFEIPACTWAVFEGSL